MKKIKQICLAIWRIKALKYIVVTVIAVVLIGFVDENSVWKHYMNKQRISELNEEIERYNQQYRHDQAQIQKIHNDPRAIRKIARERYFMKADNEDIFVISGEAVETQKKTERHEATE